MRATSSITGAASPAVAKGGVTATIKLPTPIMTMVAASICRRPYLSASGDRTMEPSGRIRNPTA